MLLLDRSSTSKCKFPDLPLLVSKLTKFLMSFLELRVSFFSNFPALFSVITHNFSEIYKLKQYIFWTKRAHQCAILATFRCSNQSSPNFSWSGFIQFLHHCSVSWKITSLYFLAQTAYTLDKIAHWSEILRLLSAWVKIHQIPHVIFETTSQFFFNFCITLQCHGR